MSMAMKHNDLKKLSDDELEKKYNEVAGITMVGLNFFLEEILRRERRKYERQDYPVNDGVPYCVAGRF